MAIEIPNNFEAGGSFDGRNPSPTFPTPIISGSGILPYDPASVQADPHGGFTRGLEGFDGPVPAGAYIIGLERAVDGLEAVVLLTPILGGYAAAPCPLPGAIILDDGFVQIGDTTNVEGVDFSFYMGLFRIKYDSSGGLGSSPTP